MLLKQLKLIIANSSDDKRKGNYVPKKASSLNKKNGNLNVMEINTI